MDQNAKRVEPSEYVGNSITAARGSMVRVVLSVSETLRRGAAYIQERSGRGDTVPSENFSSATDSRASLPAKPPKPKSMGPDVSRPDSDLEGPAKPPKPSSVRLNDGAPSRPPKPTSMRANNAEKGKEGHALSPLRSSGQRAPTENQNNERLRSFYTQSSSSKELAAYGGAVPAAPKRKEDETQGELQVRPKPSESSFALWQVALDRKGSREGIHWDGDQKRPYFCYLVIFVTAIVLFAEIANNHFQIENFSDNATLGPSKRVLIEMGAKRADLIKNGGFGRLIAAWWLHGGILHWLINMLALRNLGFAMEREFGTPKIVIIYCWSGIAGVLASAVFVPNLLGVGASGAIFGLFGACWADLIQNFEIFKTRKENSRTLRNLALGTIVNFIVGLLPIIDQFAHVGGFFNGLFLGFYLLLQKRYTRSGVKKDFRVKHFLLSSFGLAIAIVGPLVMLIVLYTQTDPTKQHCAWCEALDCVPIDSLWFCDASGCSDDQSVKGFQFNNGTLLITCPSFVGKNVTAPFTGKAGALDVLKACRNVCFQ